MPIESRDRWMPSWFGLGDRGGRWHRKIPRCTTQKSQRDSERSGSFSPKPTRDLSSMKPRDFEQFTWRNIPTISIDQEGRPRLWWKRKNTHWQEVWRVVWEDLHLERCPLLTLPSTVVWQEWLHLSLEPRRHEAQGPGWWIHPPLAFLEIPCTGPWMDTPLGLLGMLPSLLTPTVRHIARRIVKQLEDMPQQQELQRRLLRVR